MYTSEDTQLLHTQNDRTMCCVANDVRVLRRATRKRFFQVLNNTIAFLGVLASGSETFGGDTEAKVSRDLVEAVIAGIKANYSSVRTLEAVVEETLIDSAVQKEETKIIKTPDGSGTFTFRSSPKTTFTWNVWVDGDRFRRDITTNTNESGAVATDTLVFRNGLWTQYVSREKTAWIRRPNQMPAMCVADIRELGSPSLTETVLSVLQRDETITAELASTAGGARTIRIVTVGARERYEWVFDPAVGFLPVRRIARYEDGSIRELLNVTYQHILDGAAWLPLEATSMVFPKGATTVPREDGWRQCLKTRLKEIRAINKPIADEAFVVKFPDGTRILDVAAHQKSVVGKKKHTQVPPAVSPLRPWVALVCCLVLIVTLTTVLVVRRRRLSP
jgi:hypothetical protein